LSGKKRKRQDEQGRLVRGFSERISQRDEEREEMKGPLKRRSLAKSHAKKHYREKQHKGERKKEGLELTYLPAKYKRREAAMQSRRQAISRGIFRKIVSINGKFQEDLECRGESSQYGNHQCIHESRSSPMQEIKTASGGAIFFDPTRGKVKTHWGGGNTDLKVKESGAEIKRRLFLNKPVGTIRKIKQDAKSRTED